MTQWLRNVCGSVRDLWQGRPVDVDSFSTVHEPEWKRLEQLARSRTLTGPETDEITHLYQRVAGQLSVVRTQAPDPALISRLSAVLGEARSKIAGSRDFSLTDVARFFTISLPLAFYRVRWWTVWVTIAFVAIGWVSGWWFTQSEELRATIGSPSLFEDYAESAFAAYYSNYPAPDFAAQVWTNNAWIAFQGVGGGITGVWPAYLLWQNAINVGVAGGIMAMYGDLGVFFSLILPHGLMELTAIFISLGAGFKMFWTLVAPGRRTRMRALRDEGLQLINVALGLVLVLGVSGIVEGFVTPSAMPTWAKIAIGAAVLAAYWAYTLILGRRAARAGETALLDEDRSGYYLAQAG